MTMKKLLENFKGFVELEESANTIGADVNEILLGFMLAGDTGTFVNGGEAQQTLTDRASKLSKDQYEAQKGRAEAMNDSVLAWAKANGFDGQVKNVWWTARPGVLHERKSCTGTGSVEQRMGNNKANGASNQGMGLG